MPLLKDLITIPERVHQGDFVLQLTKGVTEPEQTLRDYVVTPQLVDAFSNALGFIQQAVQTARTSGMVRVVVTGHTDTVGSMAYNQRLSEQRATSVKNEMVRQGLNANDIMTVGRNFADPLVPTGPGVREAQNRRAVIDLGR